MKKLIPFLLIVLMACISSTPIAAKREAPKDVAPVTRHGITYTAPHDQMGCVVAKDEKKGDVLWTRQIYVVKYDLTLERDIQDCFVTDLRFTGAKLTVTNERGGEFELDPDTLATKVLKGVEVVARTAEKKD